MAAATSVLIHPVVEYLRTFLRQALEPRGFSVAVDWPPDRRIILVHIADKYGCVHDYELDPAVLCVDPRRTADRLAHAAIDSIVASTDRRIQAARLHAAMKRTNEIKAS